MSTNIGPKDVAASIHDAGVVLLHIVKGRRPPVQMFSRGSGHGI
jgi:hypothetical protein